VGAAQRHNLLANHSLASLNPNPVHCERICDGDCSKLSAFTRPSRASGYVSQKRYCADCAAALERVRKRGLLPVPNFAPPCAAMKPGATFTTDIFFVFEDKDNPTEFVPAAGQERKKRRSAHQFARSAPIVGPSYAVAAMPALCKLQGIVRRTCDVVLHWVSHGIGSWQKNVELANISASASRPAPQEDWGDIWHQVIFCSNVCCSHTRIPSVFLTPLPPTCPTRITSAVIGIRFGCKPEAEVHKRARLLMRILFSALVGC
jgi:hypothetical protein